MNLTRAIASAEVAPQTSLLPQLTPIRFFQTLHAYQQTAALKAAIDLDLFTTIGEGLATVPQIAQRTKAAERGVRVLCDFLAVLGFLDKKDSRYSLSPDSAMFLDKKSQA